MSTPNNDLNQLIDATRQDAQAQQAKAQAALDQPARVTRGKQIMAAMLMAALGTVLFHQYPRFSEPYTWPDPATSTSAAEADLVEVVSAIELYRITQGQYPAVLSQIHLPEGLAARVSSTPPQYRPAENAYTLEWTLPHWRASYDSQTEKVSVEPVGKH